MGVIREGHLYELDMFEDTKDDLGNWYQRVQFIQKEPITKEKYPEYWKGGKTPEEGTLHTVSNGTTNEEVLEMLIDRMQYLQSKFPCRENAIVITNLEESLMWLNKRTTDRNKRGVEGKHLK